MVICTFVPKNQFYMYLTAVNLLPYILEKAKIDRSTDKKACSFGCTKWHKIFFSIQFFVLLKEDF